MGRWRRAVALAVVALAMLAAPASAGGPGKRFAHNRGTWFGTPIEITGSVKHPRSISLRVRWRSLEKPQPAPKPPPPEPLPPEETAAYRAAGTPIPGEGISVDWRLTCPLNGNRAVRRTGSFTVSSSPDVRPLRVPGAARGAFFCLVDANARGPTDVIGKIMLDLYART